MDIDTITTVRDGSAVTDRGERDAVQAEYERLWLVPLTRHVEPRSEHQRHRNAEFVAEHDIA